MATTPKLYEAACKGTHLSQADQMTGRTRTLFMEAPKTPTAEIPKLMPLTGRTAWVFGRSTLTRPRPTTPTRLTVPKSCNGQAGPLSRQAHGSPMSPMSAPLAS
jgi:hypothetical protein